MKMMNKGKNMNKTPRTDEHLRMKRENGHVAVVSRDFARQLETELADKNKHIQSLEAEKLQLAKSLYLAASDFTSSNGSIPDWWKDCKEIARKMLEPTTRQVFGTD